MNEGPTSCRLSGASPDKRASLAALSDCVGHPPGLLPARSSYFSVSPRACYLDFGGWHGAGLQCGHE
jgi:hypothetical protein